MTTVTPAIVDERIAGSRISVHDVYCYSVNGDSEEEIARILRLSPEQVQAALEYIKEHKEEVHAVYLDFEERAARGNPPEVVAKCEAAHRKAQAWLSERRRQRERNGEGTPGGR